MSNDSSKIPDHDPAPAITGTPAPSECRHYAVDPSDHAALDATLAAMGQEAQADVNERRAANEAFVASFPPGALPGHTPPSSR
jgi:hypothetical protein